MESKENGIFSLIPVDVPSPNNEAVYEEVSTADFLKDPLQFYRREMGPCSRCQRKELEAFFFSLGILELFHLVDAKRVYHHIC